MKIQRKIATKFINLLPLSGIIPVGGYRRGNALFKDIDLLSTYKISTVIKAIEKIAEITRVIASGEKSASLIINFDGHSIHVDIFNTTKKELPYALLHYTGNAIFNIRLRAHAKRNGYKLNQYELYDEIEKRPVPGLKTERKILEFLGWKWHEPAERNKV